MLRLSICEVAFTNQRPVSMYAQKRKGFAKGNRILQKKLIRPAFPTNTSNIKSFKTESNASGSRSHRSGVGGSDSMGSMVIVRASDGRSRSRKIETNPVIYCFFF